MNKASSSAQKKSTTIETFINYLTTTKPIILIFHLFWILIASTVLSSTYIITFHFTSLLSLYQEAHDMAHFNNNMMVSAKQDKAIIDNLNNLLVETDANRAYVYRYHDGLAAVSGVPFFFQSNTHEVIKDGTSRVMAFNQRIPVSINMNITNEFVIDKCASITDTDKNPNNQNYWFYQTRSAKSLIACPIFLKSGDLLGFVGIDYTSNTDPSKIAQHINEVRETAKKISETYNSTK